MQSLEELWLPIATFDNNYSISDHGRVRSHDRTITLAKGGERRIKGRILKPKDNGGGYLWVSLCRDGGRSNQYIHRLVAAAFIPNPNNQPEVNHKDGNPSNNRVTNLEWLSHSANIKHGYDCGLIKNSGANHAAAVSVVDNLSGIVFPTIKAFCENYGINYSSGRNFLCGFNKTIDLTEYSITKLKNEKTTDTSNPRY